LLFLRLQMVKQPVCSSKFVVQRKTLTVSSLCLFVIQVQNRLDANLPIDSNVCSTIALSVIEEVGMGVMLERGVFKACKSWCNKLLAEMLLKTRRVTTDAAKLPADWEKKGEKLALQVCMPLLQITSYLHLIVAGTFIAALR
jgi:hypothetical protein